MWPNLFILITFYFIGEIKQDIFWEGNDFLEIDFKFDTEYHQLTRNVYTMSDLVGQVGGFGGMAIIIFSFLVGVISTKIYVQSVASKVYQVESKSINTIKNKNVIVPEKVKSSNFRTSSLWVSSEYESRYNRIN